MFLTNESWEQVERRAVLSTETVRQAADTFLDTTLTLNGVTDGTVSYSRVVRLLLQYYDGILYYGCPALASSHPPVCYEMLSECHEMFCNGHSEAPRIERDKYFSFFD